MIGEPFAAGADQVTAIDAFPAVTEGFAGADGTAEADNVTFRIRLLTVSAMTRLPAESRVTA